MERFGGRPLTVTPTSPKRTWSSKFIREFSILIIGALIFVGSGIIALSAEAAPTAGPTERGKAEGGLFLRKPNTSGLGVAAPVLDAKVTIDITGIVARVTVAQRFKNPDKEWLEGVYVFPMSRKGAVDHMLMRIGERVIEGKIDERKAAKKRYDAAKRSGRKASLVEQERPNLFTVSIANIPPGETITVEMSYQQPVTVLDGLYSLRFPMVVNPRYIPKGPQVAGMGGIGWGVNTRTVPDAERITPPMRHPVLGKANPALITVALKPGMSVAALRSLYHEVQVADAGDNSFQVVLRNGPVPADRDFVLEWRPDPGNAPRATLFKEDHDGETYVLAMVIPPAGEAKEGDARLPREAIFIIDTSGSMHGQSIEQAKKALQFALDRLQPNDSFNVIGFSSQPTPLFAKLQPVSAQSLATARLFVRAMTADGGTEMRRALDLALDDRIDTSRLRQIVLMTDGSVGNEAQLFRLIRQGIGDSRLFTIGIGSAPNAHFMNKAARFGRGTFTFIGKTSEVTDKMTRLFKKLGNPVLTDIAVDFPDHTATDVQPERVPDLYRGDPIIVSARLPKGGGDITIAGRLAGREWTTKLALTDALDGKGIAKLWAKRKTEALMDELQEGVDPMAVRQAVLNVALPHQIMSRYTSLVAVDKKISRPPTEGMSRRAVPTNPPAGWTPPQAAGKSLPQRAQGKAPLRTLAQSTPGGGNAAPLSTVQQSGQPGAMIRLHTRTATPAGQHLLIGLLLVCLALAVWFVRRRTAQ